MFLGGATILSDEHRLVQASRGERGFTILELLTVLAIMTLLFSILAPSLGKVRRQARRLLGASNQKQAAGAVSVFAFDHDDFYPESVATIGANRYWNWQEPMMLTGYRPRLKGMKRAMSEYLGDYVEDAGTMYCPGAPKKYKYLQDSWDAGDEWDNPETPVSGDPVSGTYCFYWNYTGYLEGYSFLFEGPRRAGGGPRESKLLMTDYFGYNHHRSRGSYGSCEKFKRTSVTPGAVVSSAYWSRRRTMGETPDSIEIRLNAAYTDGHVASYGAEDAATMKVIWKTDINEPYPEGIGPGHFFIPRDGLR